MLDILARLKTSTFKNVIFPLDPQMSEMHFGKFSKMVTIESVCLMSMLSTVVLEAQLPCTPCTCLVGRRPQHTASTSAYLALTSARWYPSSSRLVRLSTVSPVFL